MLQTRAVLDREAIVETDVLMHEIPTSGYPFNTLSERRKNDNRLGHLGQRADFKHPIQGVWPEIKQQLQVLRNGGLVGIRWAQRLSAGLSLLTAR